MAKLDILTYPDPRLHKVAKPVEVVDDRIRTLVRDMAETMYEAPGIGLAATQVDVHERVIVIDLSESRDALQVFINPEIVWASENRKVWEEGCLSVPEVYDRVERPDRVRVRALNEKGETFELEADDLLAVWSAARDGSPDGQGVRRVPVAAQGHPHQAEASETRSFADVSPRGCNSSAATPAPSAIVNPPKHPMHPAATMRPVAFLSRNSTMTQAQPLRVAFAGTPEFARVALEAIHAAGFPVVAVLTQPDRPAGRGMQLQASPVKQFALDAGLGPVLQPRSLRRQGKYPEEAGAAVDALAATAPMSWWWPPTA